MSKTAQEPSPLAALPPNAAWIERLDDPRLAVYRNLKDRELAREGGRFIAEGQLVVCRLLRSDFPVESLLLSSRRAAELIPQVPSTIPIYIADPALVNQIVGFRFHSGALACGRRKNPLSLDDAARDWSDPLTLVICPHTNNTENLGAMMRLAAAFGAAAFILGEQCCDPFYRQAIRVSMGAAFTLPLVSSQDLLADLTRLRGKYGVELAATVLDPSAEPLARAGRARRLALLFGSEAHGLSRELVDACDRRITIPMEQGVDSLNVAVAAGIVLYHFTQEASLRG